ncbi:MULTISPECIES: Cu(I)-responsive transcriptional regulator [Vibrio]|uniref:HTH-type transcriptional regulator CueR n=1 Tax=Vibrio cortegadensis TaxID=1328770 RepID=A0ABV4M1J8_9VIBR|nr:MULTISPECIES: Cu(I)-responsive transcriptional regulator [Vibrio]MDN3698785.1 Cu(I)-responsive transcriptional regulator [Vibrio cortegadensis]RBW66349.1 Cu(I)-responsive transcriptional regulator [Vibrionales bacterium C3R12]TKF20454.1 Cu(I)-responsive transcriptional regulator [Vibrio genomosp. F6]
MNISEVAKITGLSSKSVRLYEDKGLISPPLRADNGYRVYTKKHAEQLMVVARSRRVGFTLEECKGLVQLANNPEATSAEVKEKALTKLDEVNSKLNELMIIKSQLELWINKCPGNNDHACPILEDLVRQNE